MRFKHGFFGRAVDAKCYYFVIMEVTTMLTNNVALKSVSKAPTVGKVCTRYWYTSYSTMDTKGHRAYPGTFEL